MLRHVSLVCQITEQPGVDQWKNSSLYHIVPYHLAALLQRTPTSLPVPAWLSCSTSFGVNRLCEPLQSPRPRLHL